MSAQGHTRVQRVVARVSSAVGAMRPRPRPGLRVLLYHAIGSAGAADYGMTVTAAAFAEQMRWLREESGYRIVPLDEAAVALGRGAVGDTVIAITFDDGFLSVLTEGVPILARLEIPFTVFVVGGFLERPPAGHRYVDAASLAELAAAPGASIGSHGLTHRPLTRLTDADLDSELRGSREVLGRHLHAAPSAIGYPHGAVDRRVIRRAQAAGFVIGGTSVVGVNRPSAVLLALRRTEILAGDRLGDFAGKIRGDYDWYRLRQRLYWPLPPER